MTPNSALLKAIDIAGSQTALASRVGKTQSTVAAWVNRFKRVGHESVLAVSAATSWQVTPHQLRPDLYPHPNDGLPEHLRVDSSAVAS